MEIEIVYTRGRFGGKTGKGCEVNVSAEYNMFVTNPLLGTLNLNPFKERKIAYGQLVVMQCQVAHTMWSAK